MKALTDTKKYKAIKAVVSNGRRGSEWQEAGLFDLIARIVNDEVQDLSSRNLQKLLKAAERY